MEAMAVREATVLAAIRHAADVMEALRGRRARRATRDQVGVLEALDGW
jgi:hypothetical protein